MHWVCCFFIIKVWAGNRIPLNDSTTETFTKGLFTEMWQKLRLGNPTAVGNCYYPWAKGEKRTVVLLASARELAPGGPPAEAVVVEGGLLLSQAHAGRSEEEIPQPLSLLNRHFPFAGPIWELLGKGGVSIPRHRVKERQVENES